MKTNLVALGETVAVFALTMLLIAAAGTSPIAAWVRSVTNRAFVEYVVMIAVPVLIILVSRRSFASFGISFRNLRYHLDVAMTAFIPVAAASIPLAFVDDKKVGGALILTATWIAVLFVLSRILKSKPTLGGTTALAALPLIGLAGGLTPQATFGKALSAVLFYVFFLGFGEELLFRGYIQSRLNTAFGRPFTFSGVQWGWGAVIAAALFGLMHVINLGSYATLHQWHLTPWWGLWTFSAGLVNAFVREKTGSVVAPTLLHGLPQGLFYAFTGQ